MADPAATVGHVRPIPDEVRAKVCGDIRAMVAKLEQTSTAIAHGDVTRFDLQLTSYELTALARNLVGL